MQTEVTRIELSGHMALRRIQTEGSGRPWELYFPWQNTTEQGATQREKRKEA